MARSWQTRPLPKQSFLIEKPYIPVQSNVSEVVSRILNFAEADSVIVAAAFKLGHYFDAGVLYSRAQNALEMSFNTESMRSTRHRGMRDNVLAERKIRSAADEALVTRVYTTQMGIHQGIPLMYSQEMKTTI
ncbi:hypothetical protein Pmar_PMAR001012 [Perkinsus marinus ATCC 50983]|uniref:Uncharacterized protein n=1 Tax=Perkinsus marinus (strain ATCC 50983 / TXsc) TaxID=423536 RepID=C5LQ22_PERM5|nr:hypothetical protein Pmar_PMAR001012 [Perkinsus marinus ATCC 50983]EER01171.1 hypothetical protein Pmar_PMAR001012 [Perkinsus marinus ATCC 50983]|eukprot:XP_002768453.1 hypothetical protein Pmar_PMAR001012 [Perkinsus marinus ATCC 50983]